VAPKPAIRFFAAGEPTVGFKRMTEIVEEGRKPVGDKLQVELQTNGFFNGTIADWVDQNVNILWISCDGPPTLQDVQRPAVMAGHRGLWLKRTFGDSPHIQKCSSDAGPLFSLTTSIGKLRCSTPSAHWG